MSAPTSPLEPYATYLRRLPFVRDVRVADDAHVDIATTEATHHLEVDYQPSRLDRLGADEAVMRHRGRRPWILLAGAIGADAATRLEVADAMFVDLAGNCRIVLDDRHFAFDGDGLPDIFTVNWAQQNTLLSNIGAGFFADVTDNLPRDADYSRGLVYGDFDGDGDLDVFVVGTSADRIYLNETPK